MILKSDITALGNIMNSHFYHPPSWILVSKMWNGLNLCSIPLLWPSACQLQPGLFPFPTQIVSP